MTKIKHVSWRDGRPRFQPSKVLRAAGHKGQDLRHEDGRWFTEGEALDWSNAQIKKLKKQPPSSTTAPAPKPKEAPRSVYPLSKLYEQWIVSQRILGKAAATQKDYKQKFRVIEQHDPDMWASEVTALDQTICFGLYEDLWKERGLATARGTMRVLAIAIKWGMKTGKVKGLPFNPARDLEMEQLAPRARFLQRAEFDALVKAAESKECGFRTDMADMFYCAVWTGQRQADRLKLLRSALKDGRFWVRQQKTNAIVNPPIAPEYQARLDAIDKRRKAKGKEESIFVHLNEATWSNWNHYTYRNLFSEIRTAAAKIVPTCATIMEKDFRATAVTWMALAGATLPEICSVSGHSLQGAHQILKHYLALHPQMATSGIGKLVEWYEGDGDTALRM